MELRPDFANASPSLASTLGRRNIFGKLKAFDCSEHTPGADKCLELKDNLEPRSVPRPQSGHSISTHGTGSSSQVTRDSPSVQYSRRSYFRSSVGFHSWSIRSLQDHGAGAPDLQQSRPRQNPPSIGDWESRYRDEDRIRFSHRHVHKQRDSQRRPT
jgi:hypothetical protein